MGSLLYSRDSAISLKFRTYFDHVTLDVLQRTFKVNRSKVYLTP